MTKAERIIQLIDAGWNNVKIAIEVDVSDEYVRQVRNEHRPGIVSPIRKQKCSVISESKLGEIIAYSKGDNVTFKAIDERFGLTKGAARNLFYRLGTRKQRPRLSGHANYQMKGLLSYTIRRVVS